MRKIVPILVLAAAACSPAAQKGAAPLAAPVQATTVQAAPANAARPAAQVAPSEHALLGTWGIYGGCEGDGGLTLRRNGEGSLDAGDGLWAIDPRGRLVLVVRDQEMGMDPDPHAPRKVHVLTISEITEERLIGAFDDGRPINGPRCEDPIADSERARDSRAGSSGAGRMP